MVNIIMVFIILNSVRIVIAVIIVIVTAVVTVIVIVIVVVVVVIAIVIVVSVIAIILVVDGSAYTAQPTLIRTLRNPKTTRFNPCKTPTCHRA